MCLKPVKRRHIRQRYLSKTAELGLPIIKRDARWALNKIKTRKVIGVHNLPFNWIERVPLEPIYLEYFHILAAILLYLFVNYLIIACQEVRKLSDEDDG